MLNAKAFASAAAVVTAVFYIVCAALSYAAPDLIFSIGRSWMHTINLESVKAPFSLDTVTLLWGLITISAVTWVTTYATIALYNYLAKKG